MRIEKCSQSAVFARNHRKYIDECMERNREDPLRQTMFRSISQWTSARKAIEAQGPIPVYFGVIGGGVLVEYRADLVQVILEPRRGDRATEEALSFELPSTVGEGLWEGDGKLAQTLYVISRCRRLDRPFPMTELIKVSDGKPINKGFRYAYSVVFHHVPGTVRDFSVHPEEIEFPGTFPEGSTKQVSVNVYERSSAARKACVEHYGCMCSVCGFDFERQYGEIGTGFIHVHHLKPLAKTNAEHNVNPVEDLRPVCPNCHAMIHRGDSTLSIDELRRIVTNE